MCRRLRGSRNFCYRDQFKVVVFCLFLVDLHERREDTKTITNGAPSLMADNGPTLNAGLVDLCFSGDPEQYC